MQKTMTDPQFKTMDEAAQTLRISRRTLQDLIVKHPCYSVVGNRRKIFSHKNIKQLFEAMQCRSNSLSATVHQSGILGVPSEESLWTEALKLTSKKQPKQSGLKPKPNCSIVQFTAQGQR
jgi:hypothetical protein